MSGQPYASQPPLWLEAVFYVVLLLVAEFICMALWFNTGVQMDWIDHRDPGRPLPISF